MLFLIACTVATLRVTQNIHVRVPVPTNPLSFIPYNFIAAGVHYPLLHRCSFKLSHTLEKRNHQSNLFLS